jgi:hypothetical protein
MTTSRPPKIQRHLLLSDEIYEKMRSISEQEHRTLSAQIEHALKEWVKARSDDMGR